MAILNPSQEAKTFIMEFDAEYKHLESVSNFVQQTIRRFWELEDDDASLFAVRLAVHETCVNIIEHAYREAVGRIKLVLSVHPEKRSVQIDLYDQGAPADLSKVKAPNLDEPQIKGYGLFLIQQLMDSVEYSFEAGSNHWCLIKQV